MKGFTVVVKSKVMPLAGDEDGVAFKKGRANWVRTICAYCNGTDGSGRGIAGRTAPGGGAEAFSGER